MSRVARKDGVIGGCASAVPDIQGAADAADAIDRRRLIVRKGCAVSVELAASAGYKHGSAARINLISRVSNVKATTGLIVAEGHVLGVDAGAIFNADSAAPARYAGSCIDKAFDNKVGCQGNAAAIGGEQTDAGGGRLKGNGAAALQGDGGAAEVKRRGQREVVVIDGDGIAVAKGDGRSLQCLEISIRFAGTHCIIGCQGRRGAKKHTRSRESG